MRSKLCYSSCVFLIMMAITFTFASMKQSKAPEGWNKKGHSPWLNSAAAFTTSSLFLAFGLLVGVLVGAVSAFIFYFLIINKLIEMEGDLKLSLDIFKKKKREVTGVDNPMGIEEESAVTGETKKEGTVNTLEVSFLHRAQIYL